MYKNKCSSACFGPGKIGSIKNALFTRVHKGLIFTFLILQLSAAVLFSQDVLLNLDFRNSPIRDILIEIEEQTDYFFMYNGKVVDVNQKVSLNLRETSLENVLLQLFSETNILHEIVGNQIVLKNKLLQQQRTVTGKIVDEEGMPIIGATIILKGSSKGTISDLNGNFSIEIPEGEQILVFTYVGMQKQEISITDNLRLNVFMESEAEALEEVVVIGYGVQKKVDLTGSVSVINGESINNSPVIGVDQAMQGRVAGVRITQTSGQPGESVFVRIRGVGTIGDNDPLYIIDGVPTKDGMNIVSPSEIESISILKDAASSAIYGARGANGIVLITTKKGKKGEPRITYNGYFGVQTHGKLIEMANTHEYVETFNEAVENDNAMVTSAILKRKPIPFDPDTLANVNYLKEIFRPAISQGHQLNISGGNDISNYNVSFDYLNQEGIVKASDYQRYKVRTSITTQVKERLKTGININLVNSKRNLITSSGHNYGTVRYAIFRTSAIPIKYDDGEWVDLWEHYKYFGDGYNPVAMLDKYDNVETINRAIGNLFAELDLAKGLVFKSEIGLDATFGNRKQFWETWGTNNRIGYPGSVDLNDWQSTMMNWVNTLNYNMGFGNHQFNFLLGSEALKNSTTSHYGSDSRYEDQGEIFRYLGVGLNENKYASEGYSAWALLSTFGRVEYNYNNKYLVSANIRNDGSSRFSEDNKFGTFFSGSMGWRLDREDFFEPISQRISMMKIRASAGQLGNQEIGNYPTSSTYGSGYNYVFGGGHTQNIALGYAIVNRGNEAIRWETTTQYDAGIDAGFFKNKLMLTADYYIKITDDMLVAAPVSAIGGSSSPPYVNAGKVRNRGLELELMYQDTRGEWKYSIESNFTTVDNEVLSLGSGQPILGGEIDNGIYAARTAPGQPIGAFYLLEMEGIFQSEAEVFSSAYQGDQVGPGDVKYVNQNNDNVINQDDRVYVGSPIPKFTYGLSFNTAYRNFDFSMFFQGVYGNKIYMQIGKDIEGFYRNLNITKRFVDEHWRPDYPSNTMPRASWYASTNNIIPSTRFLFDGSYLRLKNVQLGYTLPQNLSQKLNIQQCRIYLASQNLLTFSNYIGMEPELTVSANDASERDLAAGIDWGTYPSSITYMIGLNFTF
jgi:TonB-dependent starch-binding outer membrane protein SusC